MKKIGIDIFRRKLFKIIIFIFVLFVLIFGIDAICYLLYLNQSNHEAYSQPSVTDLTTNVNFDQINQFELLIPKINVNVNIVPNVDGQNSNLYKEALKYGVAHYKGTALPASGSNILIFGHSSGIWGSGDYSKIFSQLDELTDNDDIEINFNNVNYKYHIIDKKIVAANDLSITLPTKREQLTLMTCWPINTNRERLVVIAIRQ